MITECQSSNSVIFCQFAYRNNNPLEYSNSCNSLISGLLRFGCPSTVFRRIRTIVVNAVYGVFWRWSWSHILKEKKKSSSPAFTYINSSSSVIFVGFIMRVIASVFHSLIYGIFPRSMPSKCLSMSGSGFYRSSKPFASAAYFYPVNQSVGRRVSSSTAITKAFSKNSYFPSSQMLFTVIFNNNQQSKTLSF